MKNDYKMIYCKKWNSEQQHFKHWSCGEYTICLGCSNAGRKQFCSKCDMESETSKVDASENNAVSTNSMLLKQGGKYEIKVKHIGSNQQSLWRLYIVPEKRAWKLVNQVISVGHNLNGYEILSIVLCDENEIWEEHCIELADCVLSIA